MPVETLQRDSEQGQLSMNILAMLLSSLTKTFPGTAQSRL